MHDSRAYLLAHPQAGLLDDASDSSAYVNSAAHADFWCGPGSAKIAIKHFFSNATAKTEAFIGGSPSFEAVDGSGIAVGQKVATTSATSIRSGDGGLGSVGDVLLNITGQGSLSDVTWIIRNNELGGQIAPNQQPLALASTNLDNFALTGAENVPNAPLFVPYQVDYTFHWSQTHFSTAWRRDWQSTFYLIIWLMHYHLASQKSHRTDDSKSGHKQDACP